MKMFVGVGANGPMRNLFAKPFESRNVSHARRKSSFCKYRVNNGTGGVYRYAILYYYIRMILFGKRPWQGVSHPQPHICDDICEIGNETHN